MAGLNVTNNKIFLDKNYFVSIPKETQDKRRSLVLKYSINIIDCLPFKHYRLNIDIVQSNSVTRKDNEFSTDIDDADKARGEMKSDTYSIVGNFVSLSSVDVAFCITLPQYIMPYYRQKSKKILKRSRQENVDNDDCFIYADY